MGLLDGGIKNIVGSALNGIFLDFVLIQTTKTKTNPWEPATDITTETNITAIKASVKCHEIDSETVKQTDKKIVILAKDLTVTPKIGDLLKQSGDTIKYQIVSPIKKDAAGATYICHCR